MADWRLLIVDCRATHPGVQVTIDNRQSNISNKTIHEYVRSTLDCGMVIPFANLLNGLELLRRVRSKGSFGGSRGRGANDILEGLHW